MVCDLDKNIGLVGIDLEILSVLVTEIHEDDADFDFFFEEGIIIGVECKASVDGISCVNQNKSRYDSLVFYKQKGAHDISSLLFCRLEPGSQGRLGFQKIWSKLAELIFHFLER